MPIITSTGKPASTLSWYTYRYNWEAPDAPRSLGVMAQEVIEVMPEAVHTDPASGWLMVDYGMLGAALAAEHGDPAIRDRIIETCVRQRANTERVLRGLPVVTHIPSMLTTSAGDSLSFAVSTHEAA